MERKKAWLTAREAEIVNLIWDGCQNREIGSKLKISIKTVEAHRSNIMKKLRVSNTVQLLTACLIEGFLRPRSGKTVTHIGTMTADISQLDDFKN